MNKYRSLDLLLQHLAGAIASGQIAVSDRWQDDEQALGLYKPAEPALSAYVSTHGQPPGYYDVDLEYPGLEAGTVDDAITQSPDIKLDQVLSLLAMHFDLRNLQHHGQQEEDGS